MGRHTWRHARAQWVPVVQRPRLGLAGWKAVSTVNLMGVLGALMIGGGAGALMAIIIFGLRR